MNSPNSRHITFLNIGQTVPPKIVKGKKTCLTGYKLMRNKKTKKIVCHKPSKKKCPAGYKLMKDKKTGKVKCFKPSGKSGKYPWMVFPRSGGPFGLVGSVGRVGNFLFMIIVIGAAIYFLPTIVKAVTSIAKGTIDVYGSWKKVKSIPTKEIMKEGV